MTREDVSMRSCSALLLVLLGAGATTTTSASAAPWDVVGASTVAAAAGATSAGSDAGGDNRQFVVLDAETTGCLDGSPYAFWVWPGNSSDWSIFIQGGGWCLDEALCEARAATSARGSSVGYNISGAWGPTAANTNGGPPAYTCQGQDPNCTRVYLPYCDGSCFASERAAPWPVNGSNATLTFRGRANLERTLDTLQDRFGFAQAQRLVVSGGSAGGLSTYLHVDHIADRLRAAQAAQQAQQAQQAEQAEQAQVPAAALPLAPEAAQLPPVSGPLVVGRPVAGFFIDELNYDPAIPSYAQDIAYGVGMFNATPPLSAACKAAHPGEEWRCWMAPYAAPFVAQPLFAVQSRFDEFQLQCLLGLPCIQGQAYNPPFVPANCSAAETAAIPAFGAALLAQMQPFLAAKPESGTWLVSCIQHNVVCDLGGVKEEDAFASWLVGGELGRGVGYRWVDDCGANGTTPCNVGAYCAPPHF